MCVCVFFNKKGKQQNAGTFLITHTAKFRITHAAEGKKCQNGSLTRSAPSKAMAKHPVSHQIGDTAPLTVLVSSPKSWMHPHHCLLAELRRTSVAEMLRTSQRWKRPT
jgi:hypothetical protein